MLTLLCEFSRLLLLAGSTIKDLKRLNVKAMFVLPLHLRAKVEHMQSHTHSLHTDSLYNTHIHVYRPTHTANIRPT